MAATSPRCPPDILDRLADGEGKLVAANPSASPDTLTRLAASEHRVDYYGFSVTDEETYPTHHALACNPSCPPEALDLLLQHESGAVQRAAASNPNCDAHIIAKHSAWALQSTHVAFAEHRNCPPEVLRQYARNSDAIMRSIAARNSNCPPEALERLLGDEDPRVRAAAASNPSCPEELVEKSVGPWTWQALADTDPRSDPKRCPMCGKRSEHHFTFCACYGRSHGSYDYPPTSIHMPRSGRDHPEHRRMEDAPKGLIARLMDFL